MLFAASTLHGYLALSGCSVAASGYRVLRASSNRALPAPELWGRIAPNMAAQPQAPGLLSRAMEEIVAMLNDVRASLSPAVVSQPQDGGPTQIPAAASIEGPLRMRIGLLSGKCITSTTKATVRAV